MGLLQPGDIGPWCTDGGTVSAEETWVGMTAATSANSPATAAAHDRG